MIKKVLLLLLLLCTFAQAKPVSLNATNSELRPVLQKLARDAGMNIFVSPEVKGRVTVNVRDTSHLRALELILSLQQDRFAYKILKNTIVVATPEKLDEIPDDLFGR